LADHASCASVVAWLGDRQVLVVNRAGEAADEEAVLQAPASLEAIRALLRSRVGDTLAVIATQADGAILFWNRGARRLYGWSEAQAIGRNVVQLTPAVQSREEAAQIMRTLAGGEPWAGEIVLRKRDGSPFRAFVTDIPLALGGEAAAVIVGCSAPIDRQPAVAAYAEKLRRELAVAR
jgi:PAS domain S-box-containing protein